MTALFFRAATSVVSAAKVIGDKSHYAPGDGRAPRLCFFGRLIVGGECEIRQDQQSNVSRNQPLHPLRHK